MNISRFFARWGVCALATVLSLNAFGATRLIVRFKANSGAAALATKYPIILSDTTANAPFALYDIKPGQNAETLEQLIRLDASVMWVEEEEGVEFPETTNGKGSSVPILGSAGLGTQFSFGSAYAENTNLWSQINWTHVPLGTKDRRVRVAILDTGLSPQQPAIWGRVDAWASMIPGERSPYDLPVVASPQDKTANRAVGHGTMVAGIIGQAAPYAGLVIVRVADHRGGSSVWQLIKGLAFAVNSGAEVANISMGSLDQLEAMSDVLDWTDERNLQVISPIGNDSTALARFPAGYSKSICVTGVDAGDRKADFSNWNSTADQAAPATGVVSAWWNGQMAIWSGTSFAAPLVTGAIADALRSRTVLTAKSIRTRTEKIGDNIDGLNANYKGKLGPRLNCAKIRTAILR